MTPPDDLSPPRRPIFLPVVIATVFLTIITMTVGFTLGERHRRAMDAAADQQTPVVDDPTSSSPEPEPFVTPSGPKCSEYANSESARLGHGPLALRLWVETSRTKAWICFNSRDELFYAAHTSLGDVFLTGVVEDGDDKYQVTDPKGNVFKISRSVFEADLVGKDPSKQTVVDHEP